MKEEELVINIDIPPIKTIVLSGVEEKDIDPTRSLLERILQNATEDATGKYHNFLNVQQQETAADPLFSIGDKNNYIDEEDNNLSSRIQYTKNEDGNIQIESLEFLKGSQPDDNLSAISDCIKNNINAYLQNNNIKSLELDLSYLPQILETFINEEKVSSGGNFGEFISAVINSTTTHLKNGELKKIEFITSDNYEAYQNNPQTIRMPCIEEIERGNIKFFDENHLPKVTPQNNLLPLSEVPKASENTPEKPEPLPESNSTTENEEEGFGWLDAVEMIPVIGSIVGAVREGMKGNWGMMALNIGFLVMDVAGLVTGGATTVAATALKTALKAGVKVAAKTIVKQALKAGVKLAKAAVKKAWKAGTKLAKSAAKKVWKAHVKAAKAAAKKVKAGAKWVKDKAIKAWNKGTKFAKSKVKQVKAGVKAVKETVGKAWKGLKSIFSKGRKRKKPATPERPSWKQSEIDAEKLFPDYKKQKSFKNNKEAKYGEKGSTRPDLYKDGHSIEVKNYKIDTPQGKSRLKSELTRQYNDRVKNLPPNTKQTAVIDVRGQNIPQKELNDLMTEIQKNAKDLEILFLK